MSWFGLQVAKKFGKRLPSFAGQEEAEEELCKQRDQRLEHLTQLAKLSGVFTPDYTPNSLKNLEKWYFNLWESDGFKLVGISREDFECCMASYFCAVAVRSCPDAKWEVRAYGFERGKYEIGVQRGSSHLMLSRFTDHCKQAGNKRQQKLYEMYQEWFP